MKRIVFHVDVNSAFLSWSAVKRLAAGGEDIRQLTAAVSGSPDKRTSVILAKSMAAKARGIHTGEPVAKALCRCPDLLLVKPDFEWYTQCSRAFMAICREYTPALEVYSIDECFLDMSGMEHTYPDIVEVAYQIKERIKTELGFTVNIGVGSNKLLAKMAGDFEKPDKVHTLYDNEVESKMWALPVRDLLYLGKSTEQKLKRVAIDTIGDLAAMELPALQVLVGNKAGEQLYYHARGIDHSPVLEKRPEAKGYGHAVTLERDITNRKELNSLLLNLTDFAAMRMRRDGKSAYGVAVHLRDYAFHHWSHRRKMLFPTDVTAELYALAKELLPEMWDGETPLRLIGVSLFDVTGERIEQLSLFVDNTVRDKQKRLDAAVDGVRARYGNAALLYGAALQRRCPLKEYF